jgi:putative pyrroloquinoline-quinone binding quinoprotein
MFRRIQVLLSLCGVLLATLVATNTLAVAAPAGGVGSAAVRYGDWVAAGGDNGGRQGNPYEATLTAANLSRLAPAWSVPGVISTDDPFLAVGGLVIFNAHFDGTDGLEAVSNVNGSVVWKHPNVGGALAADGTTVFTGATQVVGGRSVLGITALDMATGATRWFTPQPDGRAYYVWPRMATGAGMVFIDFSAGLKDYIAAFSETTGALRWFTAPAYFGGVTFADGQVLVAAADGYGTRSLDPLTGRVAWADYAPQQWSPTVIDGLAISWSSQDGHVSAIPIAQCAGKATCPNAWMVTLPSTVGGVAGANGVLVVDVQQHSSTASYLQAIDLHTGRLLWTASNPVGGGGTLSTAGSLVYSSPGYIAGNTVLTAWSLGGCGAAHCSSPVWSYTFPDATGESSSAIEVAHGHLMVELQFGGLQSLSLGTNNPAFQGVLGSASGIASASPAAGRIDLFAVNMQGQLVHRVDQLGGPWSAWQTLGGTGFTGTPAVVSDEPATLDVFVRTTAGALQHISYHGTWSGFDTVASNVRYSPTAVSDEPGRIDLFWLTLTSGAMTVHRLSYDGSSWKVSVPPGQQAYSSLAAVSTAPGVIELFAVSAQGKLIRTRFANGAWGAWSPVATASRPYLLIQDTALFTAAVATGAGKVEVFYPQDNRTIMHISYDESSGLATEPAVQTAPMQMGLSATSAGGGRIDLFAVGTDFAVQQAVYDRGVFGPFSQPAEIGAASCSAGVVPQRIAIASVTTSVTTRVATNCPNYQATVVFHNGAGIRGPVHYGTVAGQSAGFTFDARVHRVGSYTATLDNGYAAGGTAALNWVPTATTVKFASYAYLATSRSGSAVYVNGLIKNYAGGARPGLVRGAGRVVYLQRYLPSGWQTMLSRTATSTGQISVGFIATARLQYRLVVAETGAAWNATSVASFR